jgi:hypothetical protein
MSDQKIDLGIEKQTKYALELVNKTFLFFSIDLYSANCFFTSSLDNHSRK